MKSYKNYVFAAMCAALVLMGTMFIQVPSINGYVHIGDAFVYLSACFLPFPFSLLAAGLGAAIADAVTPYIIYAPFTFVVKALMAMLFSSKGEKILIKRNIFAVFGACVVNVLGYYITECILFPQETFSVTLVKGLATLPGNFSQSFAAGVLFVIVAAALDKMSFKKAIDKI